METTPTDDASLTLASPAVTLVGGKGGVGKTTCAAALAVSAAASGARTLVITTDPAPSLADVFALRIGASPTRIPLPRRASLHAVEIDAQLALERWLGGRRDALERIAVRGTWLDEDDVARLLRLSLPGIDEIAALLEVGRFARTGRFDRIVVDTAPTGHTLRMLTLPQLLKRVAHLFDAMQGKHRIMVATLRGAWRPEADDAIIDALYDDGVELSALLRDPARTEAVWVTLPEPMAVAETMDGIAALAAQQIHVRRIIVNRLLPPPPSRCGRCDARRAFERQSLLQLQDLTGDTPIAVVDARDKEPRGAAVLKSIGVALAKPVRLKPSRRKGVRHWRASLGPAGSPGGALPLLANQATRLLMFGGKGGVGKTTCAAAAALAFAEQFPTHRVLLISTDPAHSLGDALGVVLSDTARAIPGTPENLRVRELDAAARFAAVRARYAGAIEAVFDRISRGSSIDAGQDRAVMRDLIDMAPPGIDELIGVSEVTNALMGNGPAAAFDLIVMDMAPSGHALRLLETPVLVQDWVKVLMSILLKYQPVVGVGDLGALLLALSQEIGRLRGLLRDPDRTRFVAVTRAAELPRAETVRLVRRLARIHVPVAAVIVNAVGHGTCVRCRRESRAEAREIAALAAATPIRKVPIVMTPAEIPPPQGHAGLRCVASAFTRKEAAENQPRRR